MTKQSMPLIAQLNVQPGVGGLQQQSNQQQQARQGLGLRGDMAARQESLKLNLSKAEEAIRQHDGARAERYKALTEADVDALERFLGR